MVYRGVFKGMKQVTLRDGIHYSAIIGFDEVHTQDHNVVEALRTIPIGTEIEYDFRESEGDKILTLLPEGKYRHLELASNIAVRGTEMDWDRQNLTDEELAPTYRGMLLDFVKLLKQYVREGLSQARHPTEVKDFMYYAKILGLWPGYEKNRKRLAMIRDDLREEENEVIEHQGLFGEGI